MSYILDFLIDLGIQKGTAEYLAAIIMIALIALVCMLANWLTKKVVLRIITPYVGKSKLQWRRFLLERRVIHKFSHVVPAIIINYFSFSFPAYQHLIAKGVMIYMVIVMLIVIDALLDMLNDVYTT